MNSNLSTIKIDHLSLLLTLFIFVGFTYLGAFTPIIIWCLLFIVGYLIFYQEEFKKNSNFYIFARSFIIITFIGILNCIDNFNVNGYFFGFGGDDRAFFNNIIHLIKYSDTYKYNIGFYEQVLYYPSELITLFLNRDLIILDILPINWFIGAIIPVLINN